MTEQPPLPPPVLSPDGRFYLNGETWLPVPAPAPLVRPRGPVRPWMLLIAGLLLIGGFAALVIVNPRPAGSAKLQVEVTAKGLHPTFVGDHGGEDFVIVNSSGHRIDNLTVFVADGQDNWLDHHVVTMLSSACTINRALRAFECGPLTAGQTFDLTVLATAKDAGNFNYGWGVANQVKGGGLEQWNDEVTWSEAVRP